MVSLLSVTNIDLEILTKPVHRYSDDSGHNIIIGGGKGALGVHASQILDAIKCNRISSNQGFSLLQSRYRICVC
jgi:hypothetical protein